MSGWNTKKRFWTEAAARAVDGGYAVELDERGLKTPAKTAVVVPTLALAEAIAAEWRAQGEELDPLSMPITRCANSALDKVAAQRDEVIDMLAEYGGTDLLCYRAETPAGLVARQAAAWDPLLDWAADELGARLEPAAGVMFHAQPEAALARLHQHIQTFSNFEIAAFHDLVCLSGSLIIGFAAVHDVAPISELWLSSSVDELWQEEQWGRDEEAFALSETKRKAFLNAYNFFGLCQN